MEDQRTIDPSNGGTRPQNYVNVSSSCVDQTLPSVWWDYDSSGQVLFFRWRVEQIANSYATGPSPGAFSSTDPWKSAQWTVMIDTDGDGYREFAVHIDGSSGDPANPVDRLAGIYANTPSQSIDYLNDAQVHLLAHNPTAFVQGSTILNFHNSLSPDTSWPNGSAETVWDYGTTRSRNVSTSSCIEYIIDYQIPLGFLDASSVGGPTITPDTPIALFFTTANSLQNPLQKDAVFQGDFIGDATIPAPFGDVITLGGDTIDQPIVKSVTAAGCGPTSLTATVMDGLTTVGGTVTHSLSSVDFYYWLDSNGNGLADDAGSAWTKITPSATTTNNPIGKWTASWDTTGLAQGSYLIGVQAVDGGNGTVNADGLNHRTFSYLTSAQVASLCPAGATHSPSVCPQPGTEGWFANPTPDPGLVYITSFANTCGVPPPAITKAASASEVALGDPVQFTLTVTNPAGNPPLTLTSISDQLPPGFSFVSPTNPASTCPFTSEPSNGATGTISWSFAPTTLNAGTSCTLVFSASTAGGSTGAFSNLATASTGAGTLISNPVSISVGTPRLTISKSVSPVSASPGDAITYTIIYSNDSPIDFGGVTVTDTLPAGVYATSLPAGCSGLTGSGNPGATITCTVGILLAGDGPFTITVNAAVLNPYPGAQPLLATNTATITSTTPASSASATASTYVNAPRPNLLIQKDGNKTVVDPAAGSPGNEVMYSVSYQNTGNTTATGTVITDTIPAGFCFVSGMGCSSTTSCPTTGGSITCSIGNLAAGGSGTVSYTLQATSSASNPTTNTATISATNATSALDSFTVGLVTPCASQTYFFRRETLTPAPSLSPAVSPTPTPFVARTASPTAGTAQNASRADINSDQFREIVRFYQDPAQAAGGSFQSGQIDYSYFITKDGPQVTFQVRVFSYNPSTGVATQLGSGSVVTPTGVQSNFNITGSITGIINPLPTGHRLLWVIEALRASGSGGMSAGVNFDGNPGSLSRSSFCFAEARLVLDKQVSSLSAGPGDALVYTIKYGNPSSAGVTGATLTDTLPAGVYAEAPLPAGCSGLTGSGNPGATITCTIGAVATGGSGSIVLNARISNPLSAAVTTLTNSATITSDQTSPVSDTAGTTVTRPVFTVTKSASDTLLTAGQLVTFTINVLNSGTGSAASVTISDTVPQETYFAYEPGTIACSAPPAGCPGVCSPNAGGNPTLSWSLTSLPVGCSQTVSFQMRVGPSVGPPALASPPSGITEKTNTATASNAQASGSSDPVIVAISALPNLRIDKAVAPLGPVEPGERLTYTITIDNLGSGAAEDVLISDPIPANTSFVPGSLSCPAGFTAQFDSAGNRALCQDGTVSGGAAGSTMSFQVDVNTPLPTGTTTISNTATLSASNAPTRTASETIDAEAAPFLTLTKSAPDVLAAGTPTWEYVLDYANTGNAHATNAVIADPLPAGVYALAPLPAGCAGATGPANPGATITCSLGTLAPGDSGTIRIDVQAASNGTHINTARLTSDENTCDLATSTCALNSAVPCAADADCEVEASTTTAVGGIELTKSTSTPYVINEGSGGQAVYTITLQNQLGAQVTNLQVIDTLPAGFTFVGGSSSFNAGATCSGLPSNGSSQPTWTGCSTNGSGLLTITFTADIASNVGPATYDNEVTASDTVAVLPFDPLATTDEDVTVLVEGIFGTVFEDLNGNGIQDAGEPGIPNVTIHLQDPATGTDVLPSVTTDSNGNYVFNGLLAVLSPGPYLVVEDDPVGYGSTTPNAVAVNVAPNISSNVDFGDIPSGTVSGVVFNDLNANGVQDAGEGGVGPHTVVLLNADGTPTGLSAAVDPVTGAYSIDVSGLPPGSYLVQEGDPIGDPAGFTSTTPNLVPISLPDLGGGVPGSATANFGDIAPNQVVGTVFNDVNGNGIQDPDEQGIPGVTVQLAGSGLPPVTTGPDGSYSFDTTFVAPGDYIVQETDPSGFTSTTSNKVAVSVQPGTVATANFGDQAKGTVSGLVFNDINGNGVQDPTEPGLGGVTVELVAAGPDGLLGTGDDVVTPTTTDSTGFYQFTVAAAGAYLVRETDPSGFTSTTPNVVPISIADLGVQGLGAATVNFGDQVQNTIGGTVFNDFNGNGVQDAGEPGIGGVLVTIDDGVNPPLSTTTSGDGSYLFTGLSPGSYTVTESDPSGFVSTTSNTVPVTLVSGGTASAHFGDQLQGTVSGVVFSDVNGNGVQDPGEPGIGGVTVDLVGSGLPSVTTAADGSYLFIDVPPGSYTVHENDPTGFTSTTPNDVPVSVAAGGSATANFGDQAPGVVSGVVFNDLDGDGIQDPGEDGIGGVLVRLINPVTGIDEVSPVRTAGNGTYFFSSVPAGAYIVRETDPSGFISTTPNEVPVSVAASGAANADFGDQLQGTVSGTVFNDLDGDGTQDSGEGPLAGVTVTLVAPGPDGTFGTGDDVETPTTTDSSGRYLFTGVSPGPYQVRETNPSGYISTTDDTVEITVASGGAETVNFGDQLGGTISGVVFADLNDNGVQDPGEPGLGGVQVDLVGPVSGTVFTAGDGSYIFTGLPPGDYTVTETDPPGYTSTANTANVTLPAAFPDTATANFPDRPAGTIGGAVFHDLNGNGVRDDGEPGIAGVQVTISGPVSRSTTTAADGSYIFTNLPDGTYAATETDPSGYTSTTPNSVTDLVISGGSPATSNFGDRLNGSVGGTIFDDSNGNGVRDPGEEPLAGVTVELLDSTGTTVLQTATTGSDGAYGFFAVPGSYVVRETDPPGYISTTSNSVPVTLTGGNSATVNFADQAGAVVVDTPTPAGTPTPTFTPSPPSCEPDLKKVHAGVTVPGSEITYTITAVNPCTFTFTNLTITDRLPSGLELISASSTGAAVSTQGNTITASISSLPKGPGVTVTITARIETTVEPDAVLQNQATMVDQFRRVFTATDFLRVRGSTSAGSLNCGMRAHVNTGPGRFITYVVRYKNGTLDNTLTLSLPSSDLEILSIYPEPSSQQDSTLTWQRLSRTSGSVKVKAQVSTLAADQTALRSAATVTDGLGNSATCDHLSIVRTSERLGVALKAQSKTRPGRTLTYVARYNNALESNEMTLVLPDGITLLGAFPPANGRDGQILTWLDLRSPSGLVKLKTLVGSDMTDGAILTASVTMSDGAGTASTSTATSVLRSGATSTDSGTGSVTLSAQKLTSPGSSMSYLARYRDLVEGDVLTLVLPAEVIVKSLYPTGASRSGNVVTWTGLPAPTGSVKANVQVGSDVANGTTIRATATLAGSAGITGSAEHSALVNGTSTSTSNASLTLSGVRYATAGLTTDISASYRDLSGIGTLTISLPPDLRPVLTVPTAGIGAGGQVTWTGVSGPTGSVKVRVLVDSDAPSGTVLSVQGSLLDGAGRTVTSSAEMTVK